MPENLSDDQDFMAFFNRVLAIIHDFLSVNMLFIQVIAHGWSMKNAIGNVLIYQHIRIKQEIVKKKKVKSWAQSFFSWSNCTKLHCIANNCTELHNNTICAELHNNTFCTSGQWPLGVIAHQSWPKRLNSGAMMQLPYALWKLNRIVKLLNTYSAFCKDN